jgi:hypothetical protein
MSVSIRCPDSAASRQLVTLENVPYNVLLTWNERAQGWTLGLEDRDGEPVLLGRRVVLQIDLISAFHHLPGVPTGGIFALDKTKGLRSIGREDLILGRALIYYLTRAEIDAL